MNTEAARQFCHGAFLAQRCQRHLRLKLCRMLLPDLRHPVTPSPAAILGAGVSLSHLSSFRGPAHNPFFDAKDLVQARYEMVRRHRVDGAAINEASANFGVSRPTFYKAQKALQKAGLPGLLPSQRGPKGGHKISAEVVAFAVELRAVSPELTTSQCLVEIATKFGVKVHRRSLERALARKKKRINPG